MATDVLAALRPAAAAAGSNRPGAITGTLLAVVSLGVAPAVLWALRFQAVAAADRRAVRKVADWAAGRVGSARAAGLVAAADRVRPTALPALLVGACGVTAVFAVVVAAGAAATIHGSSLWGLLGATYGFQWTHYLRLPPLPAAHVPGYTVWSVAVAGAYAAHWVQVHAHARAVRRFLDEFNRVVPLEEGFGPVLLDPIGFGFAPVWALAAAVLCALSGWWGVAFAAAGATDRRYRKRAVRDLRGGVSARIRDVVLARPELGRPAAAKKVETAGKVAAGASSRPLAATAGGSMVAVARCPTPGCGRPYGAGVKFCPRCGQRIAEPVDRKA